MARTSTPLQHRGSFAFGLAPEAVERFRDIMDRECGVHLTSEEAWARAIELLALFRMMLGPLPEDARPASSTIRALDGCRRPSN